MNGDVAPKLTNLETTFISYKDMEDGWKFGLCYLVESLVLVDEPTTKVNDFLSFVEDEEFFFQYPWGLDSYYKTYTGVNKNMLHYKRKYLEKMQKKKKDLEAKYAYMVIFLHCSIGHMG